MDSCLSDPDQPLSLLCPKATRPTFPRFLPPIFLVPQPPVDSLPLAGLKACGLLGESCFHCTCHPPSSRLCAKAPPWKEPSLSCSSPTLPSSEGRNISLPIPPQDPLQGLLPGDPEAGADTPPPASSLCSAAPKLQFLTVDGLLESVQKAPD